MPQQEASTDNVEPSRAENPDAVALAAQETREATEKLNAELRKFGLLGGGDGTTASAPPLQDEPSPSPYTTLEVGLLESVRSGAIRPLRGRFVVALHKHGGRLKRRQDLPEEAFWTYDELKTMAEHLGEPFLGYGWGNLFVALSYRWLSADHPDPDGFHLAIIAKVAALYLQTGIASRNRVGLLDFAIFWDFASLTQKPRTDEEDALFMPGLKASNVWYGHAHSLCWMQTTLPDGFTFAPFLDNKTGETRTPAQTYNDSGWCFIEAIISAEIKKGTLRLDLGKRTEEMSGWPSLTRACAAQRPPPILPAEAAHLLREQKIFTAGSDVENVIGLYRSFFEGVSQSAVALDFSKLKWGDAETSQLVTVLPSFARLETLVLEQNQIGDAGAAALAEACQHLPRLKTLDLSHNRIKDAGAAALAEAGRHLPRLTYIDLIYNHIADAGMAALAEAIAKEGVFPCLNRISVTSASDKATKAVVEALKKKHTVDLYRGFPEMDRSVVALDFSKLKWGDAEASQLGAVLPSFAFLETLNLSENGIEDAGAAALAEACRLLPRLNKLNLAKNRIRDVGATALPEACRHLPQLETLNLSENRIKDAGAAAIAEACRLLPKLKELYVNNNKIGDAGAAALAEACRHLPRLEKLSLHSNRIRDAGAAALAEAIAEDGAFPSLIVGYGCGPGLSGNPASDEAKEAVEEALIILQETRRDLEELKKNM